MEIPDRARFVIFAVAIAAAAFASPQAPITLPIEVVGENGATASVTFEIPLHPGREFRSLRMQVHGLAYRDMASVQVNSSDWMPLNNDTVTVAEPGWSYGGIGGGFATLQLTLPLPSHAVNEGANTLRFRFNHSDGVVSGFRVLAFNFLSADSSVALEPDAFIQEDPATWTPPLRDSKSILAGRELWENAPLTAGGFQSSPLIRARCADCHAHDGRDLKYFNFSNASIIARSRFHGLSELEGQQIASYIRTLAVPSPGRPWNPPYQPGPGLDARPVTEWAAGAGLGWALDDDSKTLPFVFGAGMITREPFRPDGNLNTREVPIALQLPDWNHWLPQVHPMDAWGATFQKSEFAEWYASSAKVSLRASLASPNLAALIASGRLAGYFDKWRDARHAFLKPYVEGKSVNWTPELAVKAYSTQLWQLAKTWEMTQEFGLEARGREMFGPDGEARTWLNTIPAAAAPATVNIPDGPSGMGRSALTNEYFDASWYALQVIVNSGNHRHRERTPVDWVYLVGRFLDLNRETHRPEPARLLVYVIKAMQSTEPRLGPGNRVQGWNPETERRPHHHGERDVDAHLPPASG